MKTLSKNLFARCREANKRNFGVFLPQNCMKNVWNLENNGYLSTVVLARCC